MASFVPTAGSAAQKVRRQRQLERARERYKYRAPDENALHPIPVAESWPWWEEQYDVSWALPLLPSISAAYVKRILDGLRFMLQKAAFRFDKLKAYQQLFWGALPPYAVKWNSDALFAYCRVAGANPLALRCERDLAALLGRLPFDTKRVEAWLGQRLPRQVSLAAEAAGGRLFSVDFELIQRALPGDRTRDSRWREKYLPAPIGVFVEAPGVHEDSSLVAVALQIDQVQPKPEPNPVYYPDDGWGWRIAKLYFEVADVSFNAGCGHVLRTHLQMEPFCLATKRQLPGEHPVALLLRPHLRYTLAANRGAYQSFVDRSKTYHDFYAGRLEETRRIAIQSYLQTDFVGLGLEADLAQRGVDRTPIDYPYRDDARLWLAPIHEFVRDYVHAFYDSDASVVGDEYLQGWFDELAAPYLATQRRLVPGNRLDTRDRLVDLLAQVLFIAGPGHAAQHYTSTYYYRYAPAFPGAAHNPPPWKGELHAARHRNTLPPVRTANRQFFYNTFLEYRYGVFGHYDGHPLARLPQARDPIRRLRERLAEIDLIIEERGRDRPLPYDFLRPSRVPNSINL